MIAPYQSLTLRDVPFRLYGSLRAVNLLLVPALQIDGARSATYVKLHITGGMLSTQKCGVGAAGADFIGCAIAATQHF
jgi:hypothetical protein